MASVALAAAGVAAASWHPAPPLPRAGQTTPAPATAAPAVTTIAVHDPARQIEVIVQVAPGARPAALARRAGGTVTQRLPLIGGVLIRVSAAGAVRLATEPGVRHVSLNAAVRGTDESSDTSSSGDVTAPTSDDHLATAYADSIGAVAAWQGQRATGKSATVAVLDTGIAGDQPDFSDDAGGSRVVASVTVNPDATSAEDRVGHGTHIAGLIAGNGLKRNTAMRGRYLGVAPSARLISVKVSDDEGATTVADVINGLQFVVANKDRLGIRVANLSLNSTIAEPAATDPLDAAAEVTWTNGIVVVAAAGNRGSASDATWYAPANDPYVITVGAVDDQGTRPIADDVVTGWSSRGPTQEGTAKPDVVAPGAHLVSVLAPGAAYATQCPECVVDNTYLRLGGTSMAAGVASGAIADILQRHPDWTPDQVKGALMQGARDLDGGQEIKIGRTINQSGQILANVGNTPSTLLPSQDDLTSLADWTRMSFSRMSFSRMSFSSLQPGDPLYASWSRMSFSCICRPSQPPEEDPSDTGSTADPSRMSFSRMSFSRMSFSTSFTK